MKASMIVRVMGLNKVWLGLLPSVLLSILMSGSLLGCSGKGLIIRDEPIQTFPDLGPLVVKVEGRPTLQIYPVVDERLDKDGVGEAATGLTNQRKRIQTEPPLEQFVALRWQRGLMARGFVLTPEAPLALRVRVKRLWVKEDTSKFGDEKTRCDLEFAYELVDPKKSQVTYSGSVFSEVVGTLNIMDATASNGPALESCLQVALNKFIENPEVGNRLKYSVKK